MTVQGLSVVSQSRESNKQQPTISHSEVKHSTNWASPAIVKISV